MNYLRLAALTLLFLLGLTLAPLQAATFLFDATKAESAGNANWVLDEDGNVAARYPTPAASGITTSTPETYWTGALSSWGVALVQLGHSVEQLPVGGRITYLDNTNVQDLSHYQVYVVCEPNILFTAAEKTALARYVQDGGSLFVVSDHSGSDRNNDGADSVAIWNDFFSNNGVQANPFGVTINSANISLTSTYVDTAADNVMSNGVLGPVTQLKYSAGATLTLNTAANPTVRAAVWSAATHTNTNVMAAYGSFGAGRFAIIGDSSPPDDGTGSPGHTLYYGWTELSVNHSRLILNASLWLAAAGSSTPYNDTFANALRLDPGATAAGGSNAGATKEPSEPDHAGNPGGASVWWQFTPANSGTTTISTAGSDFDTLLAVYTGAAVTALTPVAANDNANNSTDTSAVTFPVVAGTTYRVAVDGVDGATGRVALALALPTPVNDSLVNATPVNYSGVTVTLTGNNYNATAEPGEPNHAGYVGGRSVWWRWTASTSGAVTVSTLGSDFDTLLAVYTGSAPNALTTVASNANYGASLQSLLSFTAVAGTTYQIAVDGYALAAGNVTLTFSPGSSSNVPVNDNFANANLLTGTSTSATAVTTYATKETGEPNHAGNAGGHSVWWRWTAPGNGAVTLTTVGSNFDTTLGVYAGQTVNALTTLAGDDDSAGSQKSKVVLTVAADTTYDIAVDGFGTAKGNATLNLSFAPYSPPANDNFADATVFSGLSGSGSANNLFASTETDEPYTGDGGHSVWWRWTAPANLVATLSTSGSTFTPPIRVYTGASLATLTQLVYGGNNQAVFQVQSGVTYFVRVASDVSSTTGSISLGLTTQPLPKATIVATVPNAYELNAVPGVVTISFDVPVPVAVPIQIILSSVAQLGTDYTTSPVVDGTFTTITMPANQQSLTLTIVPIDDTNPAEGNEVVTCVLYSGVYYLLPGPNQANVTIHDNSPYTGAWLSQYYNPTFTGVTAAPAADPDGDGVPNLLEFAFNGNPLAADLASTLPVAGSGVFTDATGATARYSTLTFIRRTDAPGLTYTVEASTDPSVGTWSSDNVVFVSASTSGMPANTQRAVYRASRPLDGPNAVTRQFLRVRVTTP